MPIEKNYPEFRSLLAAAIGPNRTQAEFAQETGISAEHLNRMLNLPKISKPSLRTLNKIAAKAYGGITLLQLMASCEYDVKEPEKETLSSKEKLEISLKELRTAFSEPKIGLYNTLLDYLDSVNQTLSHGPYSFQITNPQDVEPICHNNAEKACMVLVSWVDKDYTAEVAFAVYYCETKRNMVFVTDLCFDENALEEFGTKFLCEADEYYFEDEEVGSILCKCVYKSKSLVNTNELAETILKKYEQQKKEKPTITFEQFLKNTLLNDQAPKRVSSVEGFGFYLDETPYYVFKKFLQNHNNTFCKTENEIKLYDAVMEDEPLSTVFKDYNSDKGVASGHWGVAIINIMYRETGISFELWEDDEKEYPYENRPSIMFVQSLPWLLNEIEKNLSLDTMRQILDKYARELRTVIASCYFLMDVDKQLTSQHTCHFPLTYAKKAHSL